ncbi:hypothetical protein Tco_1392560 [Tanacetum coccineum]
MRNMLGKEQIPQDSGRPAFDAALREYCDKNYHQLLPIINEKVHQERDTSRRRDLKKRLGSRRIRSMSGSPEPRRDHSESPRKRDPERKIVFKRLKKGVFHRLGDKGKKKQNLLLKNIITKGRPHEGWKHFQKVKVAQEDIGSQNQRGKSRASRMICPNHGHIKTYNESEDLEDHLKIFQATAKTERWAMPTWCHMFNSTLTGNARV